MFTLTTVGAIGLIGWVLYWITYTRYLDMKIKNEQLEHLLEIERSINESEFIDDITMTKNQYL